MLALIGVSAQTMTQVSGMVLDRTTGKVLVGASVTGGGHTVVTNGDGYFVLKAQSELKTITVSNVGFRAQRVRLDQLQSGDLHISLSPATIQLQEVLVMNANARELVMAAISKIPKNYSQHPELFHCFYRETAQKRQNYIIDVTRISYIRTLFRFNCDWRRRLFATSFTACCEMVVTGQDIASAHPIRGRESFDQRDAFFDKVDYFLDPVFWQDYNIIEPTELLNRAIARIMKRL